MMARNLLDSIKLLASASRLLAEKCVDGIEANREQNERYAELTLSAATALNPYIGYDKACGDREEGRGVGPLPARGRPRGGRRRRDPRRGAGLPQDGQAARRCRLELARSPLDAWGARPSPPSAAWFQPAGSRGSRACRPPGRSAACSGRSRSRKRAMNVPFRFETMGTIRCVLPAVAVSRTGSPETKPRPTTTTGWVRAEHQ